MLTELNLDRQGVHNKKKSISRMKLKIDQESTVY